MKLHVPVLLFLTVVSCSESNKKPEVPSVIAYEIEEYHIDSLAQIDSILQVNLGRLDLVRLYDVDSAIRIELKYATTDNFMHFQLYDSLNTVYLRREVAQRLSICQKLLDSLRPGYSLLVYDGVRPLNVQRQMWDHLDTIPPTERGKFVSNPKFGSVHNFGAAVDLTICNESGIPIDMGAGYDDFREIAFPSKEKEFLENGKLSKEQYNNRKLLRKVMRYGRFYNIPSEWWHFNAYSRKYCDSLLVPLQFESGNI